MNLRYIILMLACVAMNMRAAVTLPSNCTAAQPKVLLKSIVTEEDVTTLLKSGDWGQSNKSKKYWTVYSDRADNTTYNGPSTTSGKYGTLGFNEKVRIAQIQGGFALVYDEKKKGIDYPHISTSAVCKGWVPMKNLLLWASCPTNSVGIYNKALIVMNLDEVKAEGDSKKMDIGKLYKNPETRTDPEEPEASIDFYFVMKKAENGLVLLAKECKMEGYTDQVLYGWINPNSFVPWSQRTCLEPNWKPDVAEQLKGMTADVYKTMSLNVKGSSIPLGINNELENMPRSTKYRMHPEDMRYPLLENDSHNESLYKVTAFATTWGETVIRVPGKRSRGLREDMLKKKSIINLIVAIDGTSSMGDYYPPIQEIIKRAYDYFAENGNQVKVGIVIYRDYTDGEFVTEYLSMRSPNDPQIASFLKTGGKYGIKSSPNDHTYSEALYKGLELALDAEKMGYSKDNSNLLLVIGDCGNDINDKKCLSEQEIIKRCVDNNVQVSAFQVRNNNEQSFLLFRQQMGRIVRENVKTQYNKLGSEVKSGFKELVDGYEFVTNLPEEQQFYIGEIRNAPLGKQMDISKLYDIVKNSYIHFNDAVAAAKRPILTPPTKGGSSAKIDLNYLKTIFTKEEIEIILNSNSLMAYQGYTQKKSDSNLDYWQPIIYISSDEFAGLMEKLQPVMAATTSGNADRKPYVEAMKALIRSMLPDITEKEMDEKDVKEVMALIAGLNEASQSLKGKNLIQIQDEKIVSAAEFDAMIAEFQNKYNKLKRIREQKYPFSITRNKNTWYWIPVDDLP